MFGGLSRWWRFSNSLSSITHSIIHSPVFIHPALSHPTIRRLSLDLDSIRLSRSSNSSGISLGRLTYHSSPLHSTPSWRDPLKQPIHRLQSKQRKDGDVMTLWAAGKPPVTVIEVEDLLVRLQIWRRIILYFLIIVNLPTPHPPVLQRELVL